MSAELKQGDEIAFPCEDNVRFYRGMTLRDYFAAQALMMVDESWSAEAIANEAYAIADAMLKARGQ